jgi:nucleoside permease NupC
MAALHALAGIALLLAISWSLSEDRWAVRWRIVVSGLALTVGDQGALVDRAV